MNWNMTEWQLSRISCSSFLHTAYTDIGWISAHKGVSDKLLTVSVNIGIIIIDGEKCKDYKKYLPGKAWNTAKNSENVISQISEKLFGFWLDTWFW